MKIDLKLNFHSLTENLNCLKKHDWTLILPFESFGLSSREYNYVARKFLVEISDKFFLAPLKIVSDVPKTFHL